MRRFCTSWRQPSQPLGPTEEGTALPDVQPVTATLGRTCIRVRPHDPNPCHPRPWRRGSQFGEGPRRPLSAHERRAWAARAELERCAGRLTALHVVVGRALLRRLGQDGQCDPSHATLATDASCSERTVRRALAALAAVGLVGWEKRLVRRSWPAGGAGATRAEQTSNAYELRLPVGAVAPPAERQARAARRVPNCGGQGGREILSQYIPSVFPALDETTKARLNAIKAARTAQRNQEWQMQRAERWCMRN